MRKSNKPDWRGGLFRPVALLHPTLPIPRSIGVSNYTLKDLQELLKISRIKPAVNQVFVHVNITIMVLIPCMQIQFHPYNYAENKPLLEYSAKHGIVTEAYSSLTYVASPSKKQQRLLFYIDLSLRLLEAQ